METGTSASTWWVSFRKFSISPATACDSARTHSFFLPLAFRHTTTGLSNSINLRGQTVLGYIFGGLFANAPNTQGVAGAVSGASNQIFEVVYSPVPEPATITLFMCTVSGLALVSQVRTLKNRAFAHDPVPSGNLRIF